MSLVFDLDFIGSPFFNDTLLGPCDETVGKAQWAIRIMTNAQERLVAAMQRVVFRSNDLEDSMDINSTSGEEVRRLVDSPNFGRPFSVGSKPSFAINM